MKSCLTAFYAALIGAILASFLLMLEKLASKAGFDVRIDKIPTKDVNDVTNLISWKNKRIQELEKKLKMYEQKYPNSD